MATVVFGFYISAFVVAVFGFACATVLKEPLEDVMPRDETLALFTVIWSCAPATFPVIAAWASWRAGRRLLHKMRDLRRRVREPRAVGLPEARVVVRTTRTRKDV